MTRRARLAGALLLVLAGATRPAEPSGAPELRVPALLLIAVPVDAARFDLRLMAVHAGGSPGEGAAVVVSFTPTPGAPPLELPPSGPRTVSLELPSAERPADSLQILPLGCVSLADPSPAALQVQAAVNGRPAATLGTLRRGQDGQGGEFVRAYPAAASGQSPTGLVLVAAYEPLDERQFQIRLACFNCGARRSADEDLFLHFERSPTGSDLDSATAIGLPPAARATDSSTWHAGDLVAARFGPYAIHGAAPESIYLRGGLYNRLGDGARAAVAGPDDTSRALLGRLVTRQGQTHFERAPLLCVSVPPGWGTAPAEATP